jgi:hypothetical protein
VTQPLAKQAHGLCATESFQRFVDRKLNLLDKTTDYDRAAQYVRDQCGVTSRGQLDSNPECARKFETLVSEYRRSVGADNFGMIGV